MKRLTTALALLSSALASVADTATDFSIKVEAAAIALPKGGIVIGETLRTGTVFSTAGRLEPDGVPAEKRIFEIGSISKVFTGLLLAQDVVQKRLSLDATVSELVGESFKFADPRVGAITLRQLATHTSGLPRLADDAEEGADPLDPYAHYDRKKLAAFLGRFQLPHDGPFPEVYSNLGAGLLGDLLSRLHGKTWEELVVERIARPLNMPDTVVTLTEEQKKRLAPAYSGSEMVKPWTATSMAGAGALRSTAADMMVFGKALAKPETTPMKEAIELLNSPQADDSIGLFVQITELKNGHRAQWMAGGTGGFRSWLSVRPHDHRIVVILINNSELSPEDVISGKNPEPAAKGLPEPALAVYEGVYDTGVKAAGTAIHYRFEARGAALWMQITGQRAVPLERHPSKKDRFVFAPVNAEIQFSREGDKVVSTTLFQAGMEIKAIKLGEKKP